MELDDLFELPKVRLKGASPKKTAPEPAGPTTSKKIAEALDDEPKPQDEADLDVDIATRAKTAAAAHDAYAAAKAAYDMERDRLRDEAEEKLAKLKEAMVGAKVTRDEAVGSLGAAMKKDKITTIPMTDRPDIRIKPIKGSKKGITRKWLVDPENVVVKAYDAARRGQDSFEEDDGSVFVVPKSGKDFAVKVWNEQPKSEDTETVIVPDPYEDEPDPS